MTRLWVGVLLLSVGCTPATELPEKTWFAADFLAGKHPAWAPATLFALPAGAAAPWSGPRWGTPAVTASGPSIVAQPGWVAGQGVAFVVMDVWQDHPTPWVQPVYTALREDGSRVPDAPNLFPVSTDSTFYSPFWYTNLVTVPQATTAAEVTTVSALLGHELAFDEGPGVLCPITPEGTRVLSDQADGGVHHPFWLEQQLQAPDARHALVEGAPTPYLHFGTDRFPFDEAQLPVAADAWFFVTGDPACDATEFRLPPVLVDDADRRAFVHRVQVSLDPSTMAVFLPAGFDALRRQYLACGMRVVTAPASVDPSLARKQLLKVITDTSCLAPDAGTFPSGCGWLDSEAAIDALPPSLLAETTNSMSLILLRELP
jgi:hypothetical protein